MLPLRPAPAVLLALATVLAGCGGAPDAVGLGGTGDGAGDGAGAELAGAVANVTSPHGGGPAYTRTYEGRLTPDDAAELEGVPFGPDAGPIGTCCVYAWIEAPDLFAQGQLSAVRFRLDWTNTAQDQANLDLALCVPWFCGFTDQPDQSNQPGGHSETFDLVTGGHDQYLEQGQPFLVGARYSNAVLTAGVAFTVTAEVVPAERALALLDPYEVVVPRNGTLVAELVGPLRGTGLSAGLMVYGEDDRPLAYHALDGVDGSRHDLGHGPGIYVVVPFQYGGALVRLAAEGALEEAPPARRLQETFGVHIVAEVSDPAPRTGVAEYAAPPASMDTFPYFIYDAAAGQVGADGQETVVALSSSGGLVAEVRLVSTAAFTPMGQLCLTCNQESSWEPANYLDDDGTYQVSYASSTAVGRVVLFTVQYSR